MSKRTEFVSQGYVVIAPLIDARILAHVRTWTDGLVSRFRHGEPAVVSAGISIAEAFARHPQRNPGIDPEHWGLEPFIMGDLLALEPHFARLLVQRSLWECAAELLGCTPDELLFHFCNLTRKPGQAGPAVGWHRDGQNNFCATHDGRTVRLLIALQEMSSRNGGTAVVPYSHLHADASVDAAQWPEVAAGGCLALHSGTLHGGSPNRSGHDREVIVVQFGLRSSTLRCRPVDALALSTREALIHDHTVKNALANQICL